jgi:hypothetical protein
LGTATRRCGQDLKSSTGLEAAERIAGVAAGAFRVTVAGAFRFAAARGVAAERIGGIATRVFATAAERIAGVARTTAWVAGETNERVAVGVFAPLAGVAGITGRGITRIAEVGRGYPTFLERKE